TRVQAETQRQVLGRGPSVVGGDVVNDDGLVAVCGRAARADLGTNRKPVHHTHVLARKASTRSFPKGYSIFVKQENRTETARGHALRRRSECVQNLLEGGPTCYQLQHTPFFFDESRGMLLCRVMAEGLGKLVVAAKPPHGRSQGGRKTGYGKPHPHKFVIGQRL